MEKNNSNHAASFSQFTRIVKKIDREIEEWVFHFLNQIELKDEDQHRSSEQKE